MQRYVVEIQYNMIMIKFPRKWYVNFLSNITLIIENKYMIMFEYKGHQLLVLRWTNAYTWYNEDVRCHSFNQSIIRIGVELMHQHDHAKVDRMIQCAVLTVSDTRDKETDKGGQLVQTLIQDINVEVLNSNYAIVKDDKVAIQSQIEQWLASDIDVIVQLVELALHKRCYDRSG